MAIFEIHLPKLYPLQEYVARRDARFKVLSCGRRWGKTRMCANIAFETAAKGKKVWWVAPVYSQSMIGWRLLIMIVMQLPKEMDIVINIADKTIIFPNGGLISFKSADHPENLRGEGLDLLIMDEADFCKESVWAEVLRPALSDRKGKAVFISTPFKEGGWFHRLYNSGYPGNPQKIFNPTKKQNRPTKYPYFNEPLSQDNDVLSFQFDSYTNPYLDGREIDKARLSSTEIVFSREFLARFVSAAGARVKRPWIQYISDIPSNINIAIGADLAISKKTTADFTALNAMGQNKVNGDIYILEVRRGRWSFSEQKDEIISIANKWYQYDHDIKIGIEKIAYQAVCIEDISRMCKYPVIGVPSTVDLLSRFAPLESKYQHMQVYHMKNLPLEFEAELLSFPVGDHDDYLASMVDSYYCIGNINNDIAIPFSIKGHSNFRR